MPPDYSIIGLSVFKCLDPSAFPAKFSESQFHPRRRTSVALTECFELDFEARAGNPVSTIVSTLYSSTNCDVHLFLQDYGSIQRDVSISFDFKP